MFHPMSSITIGFVASTFLTWIGSYGHRKTWMSIGISGRLSIQPLLFHRIWPLHHRILWTGCRAESMRPAENGHVFWIDMEVSENMGPPVLIHF